MTADDWLRTHELDKFGPICSFLPQDFVLRVRTTFDQQKSIKLSRPSFWIYSFAHPHRQLSALRLRQLRQRRHRTMEVFLFCWWNERDRRPLGMFKNWAKKMAASIWCFRLFVVCLCLNYGMVFLAPNGTDLDDELQQEFSIAHDDDDEVPPSASSHWAAMVKFLGHHAAWAAHGQTAQSTGILKWIYMVMILWWCFGGWYSRRMIRMPSYL